MALLPITTSTLLYLRVIKLDPKLSSRLRERPVTFEHSLSVVQVYTQRHKQRERVCPVGMSSEERRAAPREECSGPALVRWWQNLTLQVRHATSALRCIFSLNRRCIFVRKARAPTKGNPCPFAKVLCSLSPRSMRHTTQDKARFPRTPYRKLSEKSRMPLQPSLTGHRDGLLGPFWRLYTGQSYSRNPAPTPFRTVSRIGILGNPFSCARIPIWYRGVGKRA